MATSKSRARPRRRPEQPRIAGYGPTLYARGLRTLQLGVSTQPMLASERDRVEVVLPAHH